MQIKQNLFTSEKLTLIKEFFILMNPSRIQSREVGRWHDCYHSQDGIIGLSLVKIFLNGKSILIAFSKEAYQRAIDRWHYITTSIVFSYEHSNLHFLLPNQ